MQVLNVAYLSATLRRHVALCRVSRVSVEYVASWISPVFHLSRVRRNVSPTLAKYHIHRR